MSGALTARKKKWMVCIFIVAFVTAVEEELARCYDGRTAGWMLDLEYVYVICIACVFAVLFRKNSTDCEPLSFYLILSGWVFTFWS
jgi:uncharacterized membrane protein YeiH